MEPRRFEGKLVIQTIIALRQYISVVHHVKGRIRLKIASALIKKFSHAGFSELQFFANSINSLEGVKEISVVLPARSVVICYDPQHISPGLWKTLLTGDEEEVVKVVHAIGIHGMIWG